MAKKWYNIELPKEEAVALRRYLKEHKITFETSEAYNLIHFECLLSEKEMERVNEEIVSRFK